MWLLSVAILSHSFPCSHWYALTSLTKRFAHHQYKIWGPSICALPSLPHLSLQFNPLSIVSLIHCTPSSGSSWPRSIPFLPSTSWFLTFILSCPPSWEVIVFPHFYGTQLSISNSLLFTVATHTIKAEDLLPPRNQAHIGRRITHHWVTWEAHSTSWPYCKHRPFFSFSVINMKTYFWEIYWLPSEYISIRFLWIEIMA